MWLCKNKFKSFSRGCSNDVCGHYESCKKTFEFRVRERVGNVKISVRSLDSNQIKKVKDLVVRSGWKEWRSYGRERVLALVGK